MSAERIDAAMVRRGLAESRSRAKLLLIEGAVLVNGRPCRKPSYAVTEQDQISLSAEVIPFVGRGGLKLEAALQKFPISVSGLRCVDLGASTGGFTDCLLQHGAASVVAVDVGHDQLAESLRQDSRVTNLEGVNVRTVVPEQIGAPFSFLCGDLSFVSLTQIFPSARTLLEDQCDAVFLVKPQFEAGKSAVGKHGLVRDPSVHRRVLRQVCAAASAEGLCVCGLMPSPIAGGSGNLEYLLWLRSDTESLFFSDYDGVVSQAFAQAKNRKEQLL